MSISLEDRALGILYRALGPMGVQEFPDLDLSEIVSLLKSAGQQLDPRINELAKSNNAVYGSLHVLLSQGATPLEMTIQTALILNAQCETYRKLCMDMAAGVPR